MVGEVNVPDVGFFEPDPRITSVRADTTAADNIQTIGALGGEALAGIQKYRGRRAGREAIAATEGIFALHDAGFSFDPSSGELTEESLTRLQNLAEGDTDEAAAYKALLDKESMLFNKSKNVFTRLGKRFAQSGIDATTTEAKVLIEKEVRNIIGLTPGFEDVVQKAAAETLGFDPLGFTTDSILSRTDPKTGSKSKTEREKFNERVDLTWDQLRVQNPSISRDEVYDWMSQEESFGLEYKYHQDRIEYGRESVATGANELFMRQSPFKTLYGERLRSMAQGKFLGLGDTVAAVGEIDAHIQNELTAIQKWYVQNGQAQEFDRLESDWRRRVEQRWAPLKSLYGDAEVLKVLQDKNQTMEQLARQTGWQLNPGLMGAVSAYGPEITGKFIDILATATTESARALIYEQFPELKPYFGEQGDFSSFMGTFEPAVAAALTGQSIPGLDRTDPNYAKFKGVIYSMVREGLGRDGDAQKDQYDRMYENEGDKAAFNYITKKPEVYFSLSPEKRKAVSVNFYGSLRNVTNNIAAQAAAEGVGLTFTKESGGNQPRIALDNFSNPYGPVFSQGEEFEWLNRSVRDLARNNPRIISDLTGGKIKDLQTFDTVFMSMVQIKAIDNQILREEAAMQSASASYAKESRQEGFSKEMGDARIKRINDLKDNLEELKATKQELIVAYKTSPFYHKEVAINEQ